MDANSLERSTKPNQLERYRSAGLPSEYFSQLGNMHLHVDGGGDFRLIQELLTNQEQEGGLGKLNTVIASVAGSQRDSFPDTYASHTPGTEDKEEFEYFATIGLADRLDAVCRVRSLVVQLKNTPDVVIEVEQVAARMDGSGTLAWFSGEHKDVITSADVGYEKAPTLQFEIHHGFDLPRNERLTLAALLRKSTQLGVIVGGWFCFARGVDQLSFRSNSFCETSVEEVVVKEHDLLNRFLAEEGYTCQLRSVVERVLGVWRTPARTIG